MSVTGTGPQTTRVSLKPEAVQAAKPVESHRALMRAYVDILDRVARLPIRDKLKAVAHPQSEEAEKKARYEYVTPFSISKGIATPRGLVRVFVELHIARRLRELSAYYIQLQQSTGSTDPADADEWLKQAAEGCLAFAQSLGSWSRVRVALSAIWSLASALLLSLGLDRAIAAVSEVEATLLLTVALALSWIIVYMTFFLTGAFSLKRELFLPGARFIERNEELPRIEANTYRCEQEVFDRLGRFRKPEFPWDHVSRLVVILSFIGGLGTVAAVATGELWTAIPGAVGGLLMGFQVFTSVTRQLRRRIEWELR